jgi:hypothetical protein
MRSLEACVHCGMLEAAWRGRGENEGNMPGSLYANRTAAKRIGELGRSVSAAAGVRGAKHGPLSLSLSHQCVYLDILMDRLNIEPCCYIYIHTVKLEFF